MVEKDLEKGYLKLLDWMEYPQEIAPFDLELMRDAEIKLQQDPMQRQFYYPCLADVCEEVAPHSHFASATKEQRLIAMMIIKDW